jgi:hypothetical protein
MNGRGIRASVVLGILLSGAGYGDCAETQRGLSCVQFLELPTRGLFAARAGDSGTVHASIQIGNDGGLSKLDLSGGNPGLQAEVRVAMNLSQFAEACKGSTVEFVFAFTLKDPPTDSIAPPGVRFIPPNRFEFVFLRVRKNLELPAPDRSQDSGATAKDKKNR